MKNRIVAITCFAALLVVLPVSSLMAQNSTLAVQCQDSAGVPAANVKVSALHLESGKWKLKNSDNKGRADFGKVDDGIYRIVGRKDGSDPALFEYIAVKGGASKTVTLNLKAGDPAKKLYFEDKEIAQKAMGLLQEGTQALGASKFADAEAPLRAALELVPSNPEVLLNLAIALVQVRKWDEGKQMLQRGADVTGTMMQMTPVKGLENQIAFHKDLNGRFVEILGKISNFQLRDEADRLLKERNFAAAAEKYKEVIKLEPTDPDLYYNVALALANAKNYPDAMPVLEKAIQMKPAEKAYVELKQRILDIQRMEVLQKAQALLTDGDKAFNGQDYAGALKKYEEALPLVPPDKQGIVFVSMGRAYSQLGQSDKALENFQKATKIDPNNADYMKALAQFYLKEKKYEEALNLYADPKAAGAGSPDVALFSLGQTLAKQGNSEVAALAFERAIAANPNNAEAHFELGLLLYYEKKNDAKSKEILTRYLQIGKDAAHLDNVRSVIVVLERRMSAAEKKPPAAAPAKTAPAKKKP